MECWQYSTSPLKVWIFKQLCFICFLSVLNGFLGIVFPHTAGHVPHLTLSCFCSLHLSNQCWQVSGIVITHALYVGQMSFAPYTPDTYLLLKQSSWFNLQLKRCKERSLKLMSNFLAFPVKQGEIIWPSLKSHAGLWCVLFIPSQLTHQ